MSGSEIAEKMLSDHGIRDVKVVSVKGSLTDHYNPMKKTVNLSESVYNERNAAAAAGQRRRPLARRGAARRVSGAAHRRPRGACRAATGGTKANYQQSCLILIQAFRLPFKKEESMSMCTVCSDV